MEKRAVRFVIWIILLGLSLGLVGCQSPQEKTITIGVVNFSPAMDPVLESFKMSMNGLGYTNISYIYDEPAKNEEELAEIATHLVEMDVDLILAMTTPAAIAAKVATAESQTPVIFAPVTNPVDAGLVNSLSNPGGNVTGVTNLSSENLRLDWLIKVAHAHEIHRIYVPYNPNDKSASYAYQAALTAAADLGVDLVPKEATDPSQLSQALKEPPEDIDAIFLLPDGQAITMLDEFVAAAERLRIPLSAPTTSLVEAGALTSYGLSLASAGEQAARLADQIIRGKKPAELPVEEAKFFLAINLDSADAIGLKIDDAILNQADLIFP